MPSSTYGTLQLLPLVGGSGGGGGGADGSGLLGGGGGGGGGAILIASSTTITVNGTILANGGAGGSQGGGGGSGGAIRLVATTLAGGGFVGAGGGAAGVTLGGVERGGAGGKGRIRLEAFFQTFPGANATPGVLSVGQIFVPNTPSVRIVSVGGIAVAASPIGVFGGVDVELPGPGTFPVVIAAARVPIGTTVSVTAKPESDASVIGPITSDGLAGTPDSSQVTVNLTFPSGGVYFIEARVTFALP